jgi:c-di-GMP-binding flagellar brake protein YcgR
VSELLRSIAARLRTFVINRRYAPRFQVRLPTSISLFGLKSKAYEGSGPLSLSGYTYDISESGLAIIVPSIRIGGLYLAGEERVLKVFLEIPSGTVEIIGVPTRYEPIMKEETKTGYVIGVQIKEISTEHQEAFLKYIHTLHK